MKPAAKAHRPRDRSKTKEELLLAFEQVLLEQGVHGISATAVAEAAGVDRTLIQRYFGGLSGLAGIWARNSQFWPSDLELIGNDPDAFAKLSVRKRIEAVLTNYIEAMRSRPQAVQLMIAELLNPNDVSAALESGFEQHGDDVGRYIQANTNDRQLMERIWRMIVLVRSLTYYWCIRENRNPVFQNMDLREEDSWEFLHETIRQIVDAYLFDA